jgi:alkylated DNA nucleotide flippase Atl1
MAGPDREAYVEAVLSLVEQVPAGRATTYGLIAEAVGRGGPRQVGRVLALEGGGVPWWRVVRADGSLPESHQREAVALYRAESTPLRGSILDAGSLRVDLARALWVPS